ncbi:MAG TPA: hypothetical protein VJN43_03445 [Bryobacteraceae bacterium]|nr:hypothetical protein [Bryobacteraceae bacterium]
MKITCCTPARTAAMVAASLAVSVAKKWLFTATCAVSVASWEGLGTGKLWRPALINWRLYSPDKRQL